MKYETVDDENFAKLTSKVVSARIEHMLHSKAKDPGSSAIDKNDILGDT